MRWHYGCVPRVLLVDDEREVISSISRYLRLIGFDVVGASCVTEGIAFLEERAARKERFDAVVTDLSMPDGDGLDILRAVRRLLPGCPVLLLTAYASVPSSVEAMRLGAVTILEKPIPMKQLERELRAAIGDTPSLSAGLEAAQAAGLIGNSLAVRSLFQTIVLVAPSESSVLVQGESGTGKELVANAIHRFSRRAAKPLVAVNCAAIPENLLESELFGHVRGAFTGAVMAREGRFKSAHGGTLFLDEIGEMPLSLQGKLLRVLQERVIEPVGSSKAEPVDFRLVCATNRNLEEMVAKGQFRNDLYYRLNVVPLAIPPLRERSGDVEWLARHFLNRLGGTHRLRFGPGVMPAMSRYSWPGNVRELQNLIERLLVMKGEGEVQLEDLPEAIRNAREPSAPLLQAAPAAFAAPPSSPSTPSPWTSPAGPLDTAKPAEARSIGPGGVDLYAVLAELEDRLICEALEMSGGNKQQAAKLLGLNRTTLIEKLKKRRRDAAQEDPQ